VGFQERPVYLNTNQVSVSSRLQGTWGRGRLPPALGRTHDHKTNGGSGSYRKKWEQCDVFPFFSYYTG